MLGKLLPREGNFFEMFNQHAERIVEAARAFVLLPLAQIAPALVSPAQIARVADQSIERL